MLHRLSFGQGDRLSRDRASWEEWWDLLGTKGEEESEGERKSQVPPFLLELILSDSKFPEQGDCSSLVRHVLQMSQEEGEVWNPELTRLFEEDGWVHQRIQMLLVGRERDDSLASDCLAQLDRLGEFLAGSDVSCADVRRQLIWGGDVMRSPLVLYAIARGVRSDVLEELLREKRHYLENPYFQAGRFAREDQEPEQQAEIMSRFLGPRCWHQQGATLRSRYHTPWGLMLRSGRMTNGHWRDLIHTIRKKMEGDHKGRLERNLIHMMIQSPHVPTWVLDSLVWAGVEIRDCLASPAATDETRSLATLAFVSGNYNDVHVEPGSPLGGDAGSPEPRKDDGRLASGFPIAEAREVFVSSVEEDEDALPMVMKTHTASDARGGGRADTEWAFFHRAYSAERIQREFSLAYREGLLSPSVEDMADLSGVPRVETYAAWAKKAGTDNETPPLAHLKPEHLFSEPELEAGAVIELLQVLEARLDDYARKARLAAESNEMSSLERGEAQVRSCFHDMVEHLATGERFRGEPAVSQYLHRYMTRALLEKHLPYAPSETAGSYVERYLRDWEVSDGALSEILSRVEREQGSLSHVRVSQESLERLLRSRMPKLRSQGIALTGSVQRPSASRAQAMGGRCGPTGRGR